jgi:hypothetical protein
VEPGIEHRDLWHGAEQPLNNSDAFQFRAIVQRREN